MSKLRLACIVTATGATTICALPLQAQIKAAAHETTAQNFKCRSLETGRDQIVAADPPRTVTVSLTLSGKQATGFKVTYSEDNGEKSDPADKAKSWRLITMPIGHDYHWWAVGNRQPNLLMHGRLFQQPGAGEEGRRWWYYEEEFEAGLKSGDFQVVCVEE